MSDQEWTFVANEDELTEKDPVSVKVGKKTVMVVRVEGEIHACGGKCTHYGAPLKKGFIRGKSVTCPWHGARFDVTTGEMQSPPALSSVGCHPVKVEDGKVYVGPEKESPEPGRRTEDDDRTVVIVGGGAAANACAETLRKDGFGGRVVMITREPDLPYDRPSLSKEFLSGEAPSKWIPLHSPEFYEKRDIEILTNREAVRLHCERDAVELKDGEKIEYDMLLCATGSFPRSLDLDGTELPGFFVLRSFHDARELVKFAKQARSAVVLGAGFIGMEAASALTERGVEVHVAAPESVPMSRAFGEDVGTWIQNLHEQHGVHFHMGNTAGLIRGDEKVEEVVLSDGANISADLVLAGLGVSTAVDWLAGSGLVEEGAVPVDEHLRTEVPNVYAAGDIARVPSPLTGESHRIEHWAVAERQGQHAARAMMGSEEPYREVPFFWTMQFETPLKYTGYPTDWDQMAVRGDVSEGNFLVGYYTDGELTALAASARTEEFIACGELLKECRNIAYKDFVDPDTDIPSLLD